MGIFDSSSKSKTTNDGANAGFSDIKGSVASFQRVGGGKNSSTSISVLDGGAVENSFKFASEFSKGALASVDNAVTSAIASANETSRAETENVFIQLQKYAVYGLLIWGAVQAFKIVRGS